MADELHKLLRLQDQDARIAALRKEEREAPAERARLEAQIAALERKLEDARKRVREIEAEKKAIELEVRSLEERAARYKTQQMQTRKNEEYIAFTHEIANVQKTISELEDRELALMEEADSLAPALESARQEFEDGRRAIQQRIVNLEERVRRCAAEAAELQKTRASLLEGIPDEHLRVYERLFSAKGNNAIVPLQGEVCSGCHMKVPSQTILEVKAGKSLTHCPQCGRILYYTDRS